jgi:hypothetical protein
LHVLAPLGDGDMLQLLDRARRSGLCHLHFEEAAIVVPRPIPRRYSDQRAV